MCPRACVCVLSVECICFDRLPHWLVFRKCIPRASKSESGSLSDRLEAFSRTDGFLVNEKWHSCEMLRETDTDWLDGLGGSGWRRCLWFGYGQMSVCQEPHFFFFFIFFSQHRQALSGKPCQRRVPLIRIPWHGTLSPIHHRRSRGWWGQFKSFSRQPTNWFRKRTFPQNIFSFMSFDFISNSNYKSMKCFH